MIRTKSEEREDPDVSYLQHKPERVVVVVVFFTLTDRASTIPSNTRGCQSGTWSAGQKRSEEHLPSSNESKEKHKHTNDKEKGTGITKYTGQRKINERHSIERVWHSAGREPSDTLPDSQPCTQQKKKRVASTTFRTLRVSVSLTAQSTSFRESLGWPNQRGSKAS